MEFSYESYAVRIVLNPVDIIVRFEHQTNGRVYEQTFFERDFQEYQVLGGLDFVGKVLGMALQQEKKETTACKIAETASKLTFEVTSTSPLFAKPLTLTFSIPALRKQTASADLDIVNKKVKDVVDSMEPKLAAMQTLTEKLLARITDLEDRGSQFVVFPGCDYAISATTPSLTLGRNNFGLPDGTYLSSMYPQMRCSPRIYSSAAPNNYNKDMPFANTAHNIGNTWTESPGSYAHVGISSLKPLKYLRNCTHLILSGTSEVRDYSPIGDMQLLVSLTIVSSRNTNASTSPVSYPSAGHNPPLTDIKWITKLKNLQTLSFLGCASLVDITPLKELTNLRELDIRETGVRNTDFLTNPNLKITK
jgi:hypothetical protein